ncbi:host attachment protein [Rhizobium sp. P32RR-XVIII]|nr:host attachment protein [Rhizobium sp. P32RR-XVIII]
MDRLRIHSKDWLLVCDGSKALFLRNEGDAQDLDLVEVRTSINERVSTHESGTDRPGRVYASAGGMRSSVEAPDLHERQEQEFLANNCAEDRSRSRKRWNETPASDRSSTRARYSPPVSWSESSGSHIRRDRQGLHENARTRDRS